MIELIVVACLAVCERESIATFPTVGQCLMQSQQAVAEWAGAHPGWRVARIACKPEGSDI